MISIRRMSSLLLGLVFIGATALFFSGRAQATNYALVCNRLATPNLLLRGVYQDWRNNAVYISVDFSAAAKGDNAFAVPEGTCSWRDRPLRSSEPWCIEVSPAHALRFEYQRFSSNPWHITGCDGSATNSPECGIYRALTGRQVFMIGSGGSGHCMNVVGTSPN